MNLEQRLTNQHHMDLFLHTKHTIKAIDDLSEQHRLLSAAHAISGYKIIGDEEVLFYDTLALVKEQILLTLERTLDDLEHKGDKYHEKNFKDGVE
ncbi:hypothetical protein [Paenibacillus glycanilyticus]|nr:hypothetical protein [Paenibacillus glycanilyticus]